MDRRVFQQIDYGTQVYHETLALRDAVMRRPLGLEFTAKELEHDRTDFHLACYDDGQLVGCLVLSPLPGNGIQMRQVTVTLPQQRTGIGSALCAYAEDFARQRNFARMTLHARDTAIPFYERLGYDRVGEPFEQVTIMHWEMAKRL